MTQLPKEPNNSEMERMESAGHTPGHVNNFGSVDDRFAFQSEVRSPPTRPSDASAHVKLQVTDSSGKPVCGASAGFIHKESGLLVSDEAVTDEKGIAYVSRFPRNVAMRVRRSGFNDSVKLIGTSV